MAAPSKPYDTGPVRESARITSLDLIRGVAVLGILLMNAVSFRFDLPQYLNLSAGGSETWLDWTVGILGEIFVDQKFMGLFSLLFGAGMILFIDRAAARGGRAVLLNMWRNVLLLTIGSLHFFLWEGDVLMIYAISSFFLVALRKLPDKALISIGVLVFALSIGCALLVQYIADTTGASLAGIWTPGEMGSESALGLVVLFGYFLRALGLILVGAGLYRTGFMNGGMPVWHIPRNSSHWPGCWANAGNSRRHHYRDKRLLARGRLHRSDSQYSRHYPRFARLYEPHHPLEQPRGQLAKGASPRRRQNGADQLPDADGTWRSRAHSAAWRSGLGEPRRNPAVRVRGLGTAAVVVAGLAEPFLIRAC